jgi:hypothetical protein
MVRRWLVKRLMRVAHVACKERQRYSYDILHEKPEEETPGGRVRRRWENNIKVYPK